MEALNKQVQQLKESFAAAAARLNLESKTRQLDQLRSDISRRDFWHDRQRAQEISKQEASLARQLAPWITLQKSINDLGELVELSDSSMVNELHDQVARLKKEFERLKKDLRFQRPYDDHSAILSIHAGAGGTDAQDWAQMLLRMYSRWAEKNDLKVKTIDQTPGEEAGLKSATVELDGGSFLYGKLAGEHGVHRLVRLSPFNADRLRQTSFANIEVLPLIDKPEEADIDEKELKIDVFRAAGPGGQSVNTTDSAVRITHIPTGISVSVQNERSQLQNKQTAMAILRSKLVQLKIEQHKERLSELKGPSQSAEWGNQIRSYVLHPYKQVKDLRTGFETSDPQGVLDGNLDPLIDAWLEHQPSV
jgi:peptide chain release factor 2